MTTTAGTDLIEQADSKVTAERVLIVEDDASARSGLEQLVKSWGFIAESASDGEEALEKVTSFRPAIVITDLVMPRMDGWRFLEVLRNDASLKAIPVVVISAHANTHTPEGADGLIPKPHTL